MAIERRNPLPAGSYWLDVFGGNRALFNAWRMRNAASVKVRSTEAFDSEPPRDWVLFDVTAPVPWEPLSFGFPTIVPAGAKVESSSDTVQRPDPEPDFVDTIKSADVQTTFAATAGLVAGLGVLWLLFQVVSASRGVRANPTR